MRALRLVLFDCDGTLVDSQHAIVEAARMAFSAENLPAPDPHAVRRLVGLPVEEAMARLLPDRLDAERTARVSAAYRDAFGTIRRRPDHDEQLYPGAIAAIDALDRAGFLLGIATGKSMRGLLATLERHHIRNRFITLQTADTAAFGKPDPAMVNDALNETGVAPGHAIMIGDTTFDMCMARSAGVAALGVAWGYHEPDELRASGAASVALHFDEVPPRVAAMMPAGD